MFVSLFVCLILQSFVTHPPQKFTRRAHILFAGLNVYLVNRRPLIVDLSSYKLFRPGCSSIVRSEF